MTSKEDSLKMDVSKWKTGLLKPGKDMFCNRGPLRAQSAGDLETDWAGSYSKGIFKVSECEHFPMAPS